MDLDDTNDGDGEGDRNHPSSQANHSTQPREQGGNQTTRPGGATDEDDDDDDDYDPDSDESRSSGISNSDDLDSDEDCGGHKSYGMGDL